jgi:hypothetical protein
MRGEKNSASKILSAGLFSWCLNAEKGCGRNLICQFCPNNGAVGDK